MGAGQFRLNATRPLWFEDLKRWPEILLGCRSSNQGSKRLGGAALLADHLTKVVFAHPQPVHRFGFRTSDDDLDRSRIVDKGPRDDLDEPLHAQTFGAAARARAMR